MLTRFKVENFRNLESVDLELGPANVLIGPNGCGKSNLLKAMRFLHRLFHEPIGKTCSEFGGVTYLTSQHRSQEDVHFEVQYTMPDGVELKNSRGSCTLHAARVSLKLTTYPQRFTIEKTSESYGFDVLDSEGRPASLKLDLDPDRPDSYHYTYKRAGDLEPSRGVLRSSAGENLAGRLLLANSASPAFSEPEADELQLGRLIDFLRKRAATFSVLRLLDWLGRSEIRGASMVRNWAGSRFEPTELASYLNWLLNEEGETHAKQGLDMFLSAAIPGFAGLRLKPADAGSMQLFMEFEQASRPVPLFLLSDGIVATLMLGAAMFPSSTDETQSLLIEEPELGLHPSAIGIVGEHLKLASERRQIIVTTHSPTLLREFEPADIVTVDLVPRDGRAVPVFTRLTDKEHVQRWLDGYDVGTAWQMGALGAKP